MILLADEKKELELVKDIVVAAEAVKAKLIQKLTDDKWPLGFSF